MTWSQNSSFTSELPLQIAWDSTSLNAFKTCPRLYYYTIICGWTSRYANVHLTFGILYHGALERYDHARSRGLSHDAATCLAVDYLMKATWDAELGRPLAVLSEDRQKNRFTLVRTVVWYLEQFKDDQLKTVTLSNGKPAVELSFRFETGYTALGGTPLLYCGHIDRVARLGDAPFIVDRKTSKHTISESFFSSFTPNNQFTGYILGARVLMPEEIPHKFIVDAAQIAVTFSRFERGIVERSDFQIDEWFRGLGANFKLAEAYASANFWPLNETACGNYGGCPFREVCSKKSQRARDEWLEAAFVKRCWDPLQVRGDI